MALIWRFSQRMFVRRGVTVNTSTRLPQPMLKAVIDAD
jgi:hypothetical protein